MGASAGQIISFVIALLLIGILLPIGLDELLAFTDANSTIQTLVSSVLPIIAVIGLVLGFVPKMRGN